MSVELDKRLAAEGTKFLLFPQPSFLHKKDSEEPLFANPETVVVSTPPEKILPGPADDRMYVVDAKFKLPYEDGGDGPPYTGPALMPVEAGPDGHFVHLDPGTRPFRAATMYATVRRVLDIWEDYFTHEIPWHFEAQLPRLEMIPLIEWDNAQSGFGFLEFGYGRTENGTIDHDRPYCENFDVLAHELGHSIIFSQVGFPKNPTDQGIDYGGFHESAGDLTAIVALLHFDSFVDLLLEETDGNLLTVNGLDRVGELSDSRQIRVALNAKRMRDVGAEPHDRSLPLTGACFDTMVELFQQELVDRGLITQELRVRSTNSPAGPDDLADIARQFRAAYEGHEKDFKESLLTARDEMGRLLAVTWSALSPDFMTYHDVFAGLIAADRKLHGGAHQQLIRDCFAWRGIDPAPRTAAVVRRSLDKCGLRPAAPVRTTL